VLFDPVLNSAVSADELVVGIFGQQIMTCSHCHMPIKGRFHRSGEEYYDDYCWQFKYVIDPLFLERAARKTMKELDED
jgi:hypothetical protein